MEKRLDCRDIGLNCLYSVYARTEDEVMQRATEHIRAVHGGKRFSEEFYDKVLASIRERVAHEREMSPDEFLYEACSGTCTC